jgi:hypothetical protein
MAFVEFLILEILLKEPFFLIGKPPGSVDAILQEKRNAQSNQN